MARYSVQDERVKSLIEKSLLPLYLVLGSVNAMSECLNKYLNENGYDASLYPNRIHALLSDDPRKFVNESTIETAEVAAKMACSEALKNKEDYDENLKKLQEKIALIWPLKRHSATVKKDIANELNLPAAVVDFVLKMIGIESESGPAGACAVAGMPRKLLAGSGVPDWSFQDVAHNRCIWALSTDPNVKIGLVVPTGGGKTRLALRIALSELARTPDTDAVVFWVTHRKNLRDQSRRELQKMLLEGVQDLPEHSAMLLAERIKFIMVSQLNQCLSADTKVPALIIVDEAHHAAADSYQPIFETSYPLRGLFLTATPNRTDDLPIGIDFVAYNINYRELHNKGVILIPEFEDIPVEDFEWSDSAVTDLADRIINRTAKDFTKTLVLAPRIIRVEEFYNALLERLDSESDHPLSPDDIGYIHGSGNSMKTTNDEFLSQFELKPRAIIVSAQILLEGFNDPAINSVVITYPSGSLVQLMQAAGRCVRYSPGKKKAIVCQARNSDLAYHFDQRWLYQDISDELRPSLEDDFYSDINDLRRKVVDTLELHNVDGAEKNAILKELDYVTLGDTCRLMMSGLPYFGTKEDFNLKASWSAILETYKSMNVLVQIFNDFCARGAKASDPTDLMRHYSKRFGFRKSIENGSGWKRYNNLLLSMCQARRELFENGYDISHNKNRPYKLNGPTTWLRMVSFHYTPAIPNALSAFLEDCYNATELLSKYTVAPEKYGMVFKIPLPVFGCEGHLVTSADKDSFVGFINDLKKRLAEVEPQDQVWHLNMLLGCASVNFGLPLAAFMRLEFLVRKDGFSNSTLEI